MSVFEQRKLRWCPVHDVKKQVVYKKIKRKEHNIFKKKVCVDCLIENFEKKTIPKSRVRK